jgi:hypothetical protein
MTVVSIGEKTCFPQPVDGAWGRALVAWGRRCVSVRAVTGPSTNSVRRLSTDVWETRWISRGRRGGQSSESSYRGPTVDGEAAYGVGSPPLIHRVTGPVTGPGTSYPQSPQHLRRRLVIPSKKTKTITTLWMSAADGAAKDTGGERVPRQVRIKTFVAGGIE